MAEQPVVEQSKKLPALIYKLGWVSFFADVSSEMVYPIVPLFVVGVLAAPAAALGMIEGVATATVAIMKGWSGLQSDRSGKRTPFIQTGYGLSGFSKPLIALATTWPFVLLARALDRVGKGVRTTARDALISDAVPQASYGRAFGLHSAMDTAGALAGVVLAFFLMRALPGNYRLMFLLAGIPGAISLVITLTLKDKPAEASGERPPVVPIRTLGTPYWRALVLTVVFTLANSSDTFLLLKASGLGYEDSQVIALYALYNLVLALGSYPVGRLSDRIGRWPTLFGGWLLYAGVYAGVALAGRLLLIPMLALYGVSIAVVNSVNKALVADLAPKHGKGTAMGVFYFATGLAALAASVIAGWSWDRFGPAMPFWIGAGFAAVAAALIPVTMRFGVARTEGSRT